MKKSVQDTLDKTPEFMRCDIGKVDDNLYEKMKQFSQAEQEHIPSPGTWLEYELKHEVKQQSEVVQRVAEIAKRKRLSSIQDKTTDDRISIKKPRKVLLRVDSKANMRTKGHGRERSI